MATTDEVLKGVIRQYLAELPPADLDALVKEIREPDGHTPPDTAKGDLRSGRQMYEKTNGGRNVEVDGADRYTTGGWS